ncbi:LPS export ABC transporter permease LptG [Methyloglobulus sp.]|uniref:LPS export ABC transporter permease LptG n=1 Tax=Methyloglobulus sp. TaxID=2518622 RepID=UPI003988B0BC
MNVLSFYIAKEILKGSLIALLVLLTLFNLFTFADELKDLGKGHYGLKQIFFYLSLTSPRVLFELVPASALIGSLFVLGAMGNTRELVAMQASGLSVLGIIKATMLAGLVLVTVSVLIGEFIAPLGERLGQKIKMSAINEQVIMNSKYGLWLREGSSYVNVRQAGDDGGFSDISIYELDGQHRLHRAIHADKAIFLGNNTWKLTNIRQSVISTQHIQVSQQIEQTWKSSIAPNLLKIVVVDPNDLSLYDLAMYVEFLKANHQKSHTYEAAFWARAVSPLTTFVMLLVSAPFVVGIHRGVSVGARIMIGVTIGMGFNIVDKIVNHMGLIYNLNPPLMALLPSLTVFAVVLFAMKKAKT